MTRFSKSCLGVAITLSQVVAGCAAGTSSSANTTQGDR